LFCQTPATPPKKSIAEETRDDQHCNRISKVHQPNCNKFQNKINYSINQLTNSTTHQLTYSTKHPALTALLLRVLQL
jgi:hypothetical protein